MYRRQPEHAVPERSYEWADGTKLAVGRRTLVMGILNATPDSFSDGGRHHEETRRWSMPGSWRSRART